MLVWGVRVGVFAGFASFFSTKIRKIYGSRAKRVSDMVTVYETWSLCERVRYVVGTTDHTPFPLF